jgi:aminopeptidase C
MLSHFEYIIVRSVSVYTIIQIMGFLLELPGENGGELSMLRAWVKVLGQASLEDQGDELRHGCARSLLDSQACPGLMSRLVVALDRSVHADGAQNELRCLSELTVELLLTLLRLLQVGLPRARHSVSDFELNPVSC